MEPRILIAEPDADLLKPLVSSLSAGGYTVIPVATGLETLKQARAFLPEIIILDSRLPDIDGLAVCDILRRLPSTATTPIILMTWSGQAARPVSAETGPDLCLTKPFTPGELAERIGETLSRWREIRLDRAAFDQFADLEPRIDCSEV